MTEDSQFCADVLDILKRRKVTFRGLEPEYLEVHLDGGLKMWFQGYARQKDGSIKLQRKGITLIDLQPITQAAAMGNSNVIADLCEQVIDNNSARFY